MDNNPTPSSPPPNEQTTPVVAPVERTSHFSLLFITLVVLGILFLGGTYLLVATQKASKIPLTNKTVETQSELHQLEEEAQSLQTSDIENDFTEVDQELKNL